MADNCHMSPSDKKIITDALTTVRAINDATLADMRAVTSSTHKPDPMPRGKR